MSRKNQRLKQDVVDMINGNSQLIADLSMTNGIAITSANRWVYQNSWKLTLPMNLKIIRKHLGITNDVELVYQETNELVNH